MVKFKGINHLAMVTGDMEKTVRFYRDVLGLPLVATTGNRPELYPYRHYFFALGEGNTIAFFEWPGMVDEFHKPAGAPASGRVQFDHVSFNVESEEVLLELKTRLEQNEVEVTRVWITGSSTPSTSRTLTALPWRQATGSTIPQFGRPTTPIPSCSLTQCLRHVPKSP